MISRLTLRAWLALAILLMCTAALTGTALYLLGWTDSHYARSLTDDLRRESRAVAGFAATASDADLPALVRRAGRDLASRITIIRADGVVLADSQRDFRQMASHADRPEVRQALVTGFGVATRTSDTLGAGMLYVATSYRHANETRVSRVARPLASVRAARAAIQRVFLLAALAALLLAALVAPWLAARVTASIEEISRASGRLAAGDLAARARLSGARPCEVQSLAEHFNEAAARLQAGIAAISEQRARLETLFDRALDGLVLVGPDERIIAVNPAARGMLRLEDGEIAGRTLIEATLNHDLAGLVERVLRTREPAALEVTTDRGEGPEALIHAYVDPIPEPDGGQDALIVLHDVTAARRTESVRRDFVANVSHELRTPLASIRAMAETIGLRREADPDVVEELSASIVRETDRLNLLASDLLALAQAESGRRELSPEQLSLADLARDVLDRAAPAAARKSIELACEVSADETLRADRASLYQVLLNLVDNAISYTPQGGRVAVSASREGGTLAIRVSDNGIGIPEAHLPRVFERFYRVDRARSRESGGTGLGLSIVKHLTELLGGSVSVTSRVGEGSTFTVTLPSA